MGALKSIEVLLLHAVAQDYLENATINPAMMKKDAQADLRLRRAQIKHVTFPCGTDEMMLLFEGKHYIADSQGLHTGDFQSYLIEYVPKDLYARCDSTQ